MRKTTCTEIVHKSGSDFDAHGTFATAWTEPCTASTHKAGRCKAHHDQHLRMLRVRVEHARSLIAQAEREIAVLEGP